MQANHRWYFTPSFRLMRIFPKSNSTPLSNSDTASRSISGKVVALNLVRKDVGRVQAFSKREFRALFRNQP